MSEIDACPPQRGTHENRLVAPGLGRALRKICSGRQASGAKPRGQPNHGPDDAVLPAALDLDRGSAIEAPCGGGRLLDDPVRAGLGASRAQCGLGHRGGEAYTYNNRINRLAIIQEHRMILKAIERGVSEDRLAAVLNVNPDHIRRKRRLLDGICEDAAALLEDKYISINSFAYLKKMRPERQVEAAQLMLAMNNFTISYAKTLLIATPEAQLAPGRRRIQVRGVTEEQLALMQRESASLDREFRLIEDSYAADHLDVVLARGYLARLVGNPKVARYLEQHHKEILSEFIQITERQATAA